MNDEMLKERLEKVQGKSKFFVRGMMAYIRNYPEVREDVVKFLKDNPDAKSDEILEYTDSLLDE